MVRISHSCGKIFQTSQRYYKVVSCEIIIYTVSISRYNNNLLLNIKLVALLTFFIVQLFRVLFPNNAVSLFLLSWHFKWDFLIKVCLALPLSLSSAAHTLNFIENWRLVQFRFVCRIAMAIKTRSRWPMGAKNFLRYSTPKEIVFEKNLMWYLASLGS